MKKSLIETISHPLGEGFSFPIDNDAGLLLGRNVGYLVTNAVRGDGVE